MKTDISDSRCFPSPPVPFFFGLLITSSRGLLFRPPLSFPSPSHTQKAEPCLNPAALINLTDFVNYLFCWPTAYVWAPSRPSLKYSMWDRCHRWNYRPGIDNLKQMQSIPSSLALAFIPLLVDYYNFFSGLLKKSQGYLAGKSIGLID